MTKSQGTRHSLLMSAIALLLCFSMLIGTTFAWFTDSVTSVGNKIQAGNLKLDLELLDKDTEKWNSIKESKAPIFDYDLWEPGHTDVKVLKIENEGTLALKWYAKFISADDLSILADVIDVYVKEGVEEYPENRTVLSDWTKVGTVRDFVNTIETTTTGNLEAGAFEYLGIALKMQEEANNDYQGLTLGAFDIMILATQLTYEKDSFDDQYDANAEYDKVKLPAKNVTVTSAEEFEAALSMALAEDREMIIDATDVTIDINDIGTDLPTGKKAVNIPGGITIQNLNVIGSYRGGNALYFQGTADQEIVFENCNFTLSGRTMGFDFLCAEDGVNSVVYNNCSFNGAVVLEFLNSHNGVATYNICTFTQHTIGNNYVMANGGTHLFNGCKFDYTGLTQSNIGVVNTASINSVSESDGSNSTVVILDDCTRINCGTHKYGSDSTLTIK